MITLGQLLGIAPANINKDTFVWNLRRKLAREMSYVIWGNNLKFLSLEKELEEKFDEFKDMNELLSVLSWSEFNLSLYGRSIVCLNKTKTGKYMMSVPHIWFLQGISKTFVTPQAAVIYQRINLDEKLIIIKSTYTTTYCRNELWGMNENEVVTFGETSKVWKDLQIEPYWEHNLGFVPVVEFTNISAPYAYWMNTNWNHLTDWSFGVSYEDAIWDALKNLRKELVMCHSRILVEDANQQMIDTIKSQLDCSEDEFEDFLGDYVMNTGIGNKAVPVAGVGDFNKYSNVIFDLLDMYFKFAGSARFSEGGGAQKTVAESGSQFKTRNEFIEYKINLRVQKLTELFYKYFRCCGIEDTKAKKFVIRLTPNVNKDDISYIETQVSLVTNNVISPIDWIKDYYQCDTEQAQAIFDRNKEMTDKLQEDQINKMAEGYKKTITADGEHTAQKGDRFK